MSSLNPSMRVGAQVSEGGRDDGSDERVIELLVSTGIPEPATRRAPIRTNCQVACASA